MLAIISVSDGYGTEGSSTPTTVAEREPRRTTLPSTVGSLFSVVDQKRYVSTIAPAAFGPSSCASSNRPITGCKPTTSKYAPSTTPAVTSRGSPSPTMVKPMDENSPSFVIVLKAWLIYSISGTEKLAFSV